MVLNSTQKKLALGALGVFAGALTVVSVLGARRPRQYPAADTLLQLPDEDVWVTRQPDGLLIAWRGPARSARVYAGPQPDAIDHARSVAETEAANALWVPDPAPASRHYFEVAFEDGERVRVAERHVPLAQAVNLRDLGGYRTAEGRHVRWGRVYRSGSLADLTEADVAALAGLGLRLVCDLRTPKEAARYPGRLPADPGLTYFNLPAYADGGTAQWLKTLLFRRMELDEVVLESYRRMVDGRPEIFGEALRRLADPAQLPGLVHCTAGKDRTGLAMAFLLLLLGVPEDTVVADYTLSNLAYEEVLRAAREDVERLRSIGIAPEELRPIMGADARTLTRTLAYLRARHGSVEAYLQERAGVTPEIVERLRQNLLE